MGELSPFSRGALLGSVQNVEVKMAAEEQYVRKVMNVRLGVGMN